MLPSSLGAKLDQIATLLAVMAERLPPASTPTPQSQSSVEEKTSLTERDATAALRAHEEQLVPRAERLERVLATGRVRVDSAQVDALNRLHTVAHSPSQPTRVTTLSPALLPRFATTDDEHSHAIQVKAIELAGKDKTFKARGEFVRVINEEIRLRFNGDNREGMLMLNYKDYVLDLDKAHGWKTANAYHWAIMELVVDGNHDLFHGSSPWFSALALDKAIPRSHASSAPRASPNVGGGSSTGRQTPRAERAAPPGNLMCPFHGRCDHDEAGCRRLSSNPALKGQRSTAYRP
jgi:uncharacterized C2H2 Zn-finger protein